MKALKSLKGIKLKNFFSTIQQCKKMEIFPRGALFSKLSSVHLTKTELLTVLHLRKCYLIIQEVMKVVVLQHGISKAMRDSNVEEIL